MHAMPKGELRKDLIAGLDLNRPGAVQVKALQVGRSHSGSCVRVDLIALDLFVMCLRHAADLGAMDS